VRPYKPSQWGFIGLSFCNQFMGGFMFPRFDYLFNIALIACIAFMGFYLAFNLFNLIGV
jgi:hypothetical protein